MKLFIVVESLNTGAVETWLVRTFLEIRKLKPEWTWTFYCIIKDEGINEKLAVSNGARIIKCEHSLNNKFQFLRGLRKTLIAGSYDVYYSQHDYLGAFYSLAVIGIKFKRKLLHVHNPDRHLPTSNKFLANLLLKPLATFSFLYFDKVIGISNHILKQFSEDSIYVPKKKLQVHYCGLEINSLPNINRAEYRKSFLKGSNKEDRILLFVGRLDPHKNPMFLIQVLAEILKIDHNFSLLIVGEGELLGQLKSKTIKYGVENKVLFLGWRNDVRELMFASDLFLFARDESRKEGLGFVVVEGQTVGLKLLLSYGVPEDGIVCDDLAKRISIDLGPRKWAEECINLLEEEIQAPHFYLNKMKQSKFELTYASRELINILQST